MRPFLSSLTRITNLASVGFSTKELSRTAWATGDYVVGRVVGKPGRRGQIELASGRMTDVSSGDQVVGALGVRYATLEVVGDWQAIDDSRNMQALSAAGLFGRMTTMSNFLPPLVSLKYEGHVQVEGRKACMNHYIRRTESRSLTCPVFLIIGTSMSSGKTATAKVIIRQLAQEGRRVVGAKLTGTGRYRDTLAMWDAGAQEAFDFVDVGLPSTVCPEGEYCVALDLLLSKIAAVEPEILVAEIGASPMEPYNGAVAIDRLEKQIRCTALCASDPFAVMGVMQAYRRRPDFVAGVATSTEAGTTLINKLTGLPALNVFESSASEKLEILLARCWN